MKVGGRRCGFPGRANSLGRSCEGVCLRTVKSRGWTKGRGWANERSRAGEVVGGQSGGLASM